MCVALVTDKGRTLTADQLRAGWAINSDGAGFAFVDPEKGKVIIQKGFMQFDAFRDSYLKHAEEHAENSPFLVHMRIRTSGATNPNNCHPFAIKGGAMIHNGIMFTPGEDKAGKASDRKSDTRVFAEDLFNILQMETVRKAEADIQAAIGQGNKLCFLYDDAQFFILGEKKGTWDDGIWHSNSSCQVRGNSTRYPL